MQEVCIVLLASCMQACALSMGSGDMRGSTCLQMGRYILCLIQTSLHQSAAFHTSLARVLCTGSKLLCGTFPAGVTS